MTKNRFEILFLFSATYSSFLHTLCICVIVRLRVYYSSFKYYKIKNVYVCNIQNERDSAS